nr:hypothetical protein [Burkholderia sp. BCC1988]
MRLSDAAGADQRDERFVLEQSVQFGRFRLAADHRTFARRSTRAGTAGRFKRGGPALAPRKVGRRREPVAAARFGPDPPVLAAEQLAQRRDVDLDVVLDHDRVRPHGLHDLVLRHEPAGRLHQQLEDLECPGTDIPGLPVDADFAAFNGNRHPPERVHDPHSLMLRGTLRRLATARFWMARPAGSDACREA